MTIKATILNVLEDGALSVKELTQQTGSDAKTVRNRVGDLIQEGQVVKSGHFYSLPDGPDVGMLKTIEHLRAEVNRLRSNEITTAWARSKIAELVGQQFPPVKVGTRRAVGSHQASHPVLMLSDLHWGETVFPGQVHNMNGFNLNVARARLKQVVERTADLFLNHIKDDVPYPGIQVWMLGDNVTGNIHTELKATNEVEIMEQFRDVCRYLAMYLRFLADQFGRVHVVGTPGNHGRTTMKPQMKHYAATNFDWLLMEMLSMILDKDERITFTLHTGREILHDIADHRFLILHGDQFTGGDGMIGPKGPITRGDVKKRINHAMMNEPYDIMVGGHFHRWMADAEIMFNGSLKGLDEYGLGKNLKYERPLQIAFSVHPEVGVNYIMPVYAGEHRDLWPD